MEKVDILDAAKKRVIADTVESRIEAMKGLLVKLDRAKENLAAAKKEVLNLRQQISRMASYSPLDDFRKMETAEDYFEESRANIPPQQS